MHGANFVTEKIEISCIAFCNVHSSVSLSISVSVKVVFRKMRNNLSFN